MTCKRKVYRQSAVDSKVLELEYQIRRQHEQIRRLSKRHDYHALENAIKELQEENAMLKKVYEVVRLTILDGILNVEAGYGHL